jgi:hypothetical protein
MRQDQTSVISSKLLGVTAYQAAQGHKPARKFPAHRAEIIGTPAPQPKHRAAPASTARRPAAAQDDLASKEIKISLLKSLQGRSNSGMVKIRDVASALDSLLKTR